MRVWFKAVAAGALGLAGSRTWRPKSGRVPTRTHRTLRSTDGPGRPESLGRLCPSGMACTSDPRATAAALSILNQGGSAVDAALAANAVLGVVEPMSCGIGGDLYSIVWDSKTGKLSGLRTPAGDPQGACPGKFFERRSSRRYLTLDR